MTTFLCLVYLLSAIISVLSNPLGQLQSCNVCPPSSYSTPTANPIVQHPGNSNPYPQAATAQVPAGYPGPLGETLNQIILNRILSNPSLLKIADPNTKFYNQNGDEVQRQVPNTGVPNVINNYFIVPPEFFNLNETVSKNDNEELRIAQIDKAARPRRRKSKRRLKKIKQTPSEEEEIVTRSNSGKRRNKNKSEKVKRKRKRIDNRNESNEVIDELDESQESCVVIDQEKEINRDKKRRPKIKEIEQIKQQTIDESDEVDFQESEDFSPVIENREREIKKLRKSMPNTKNKAINEESQEIVTEVPKPKIDKDIENESKDTLQTKKTKKKRRKESSNKKSEDKILKNIEIPTDLPNRVISENRKTRDSKKKEVKKEPEQKYTNAPKREPVKNITPFSDDILKKFFPHMPMGQFYNPNSNYPYNFDQYYQYLDPVRNSDANRNKNKRKNQNKKNNEKKSNTHTIEIMLKPMKKENTTETPVITEQAKVVQEVIASVEVEQNRESIEQVTAIPMEKPHKVSPVIKDDIESSSKESYETFSKLEDLHDFITPELGTEDEVPTMSNNGIINDYYPIFDDDVYYNPYAENVKTLDDDRYFYETGIEDKINRERKKYERYEDSRTPKQDTNGKEPENTGFKTKKAAQVDPYINKYDHDEYLDHIATFSETPEHDVLKVDDIRRVKVPSKNTRVRPETVETVFAGSKVAKYGVTSEETIDDISSNVHNDESSYSSGEHTSYVVAKSLGRPEDYW